jgi:hypothetical protein
MLATRLVHLIELHADQLSHRLIRKLENDPLCVELRKVPVEELRARSYEVYRHPTGWSAKPSTTCGRLTWRSEQGARIRELLSVTYSTH